MTTKKKVKPGYISPKELMVGDIVSTSDPAEDKSQYKLSGMFLVLQRNDLGFADFHLGVQIKYMQFQSNIKTEIIYSDSDVKPLYLVCRTDK